MTKYAAKIGSIIYTIVETQIDIAFAILMINCFTKNPGPEYFSAINQILKYLAGSPKRGIIFQRKSKLNLVGYWDFD